MTSNQSDEEDDSIETLPEDPLSPVERPVEDDPRKRWLEAKVRACLFSETEERIQQLISSDSVL